MLFALGVVATLFNLAPLNEGSDLRYSDPVWVAGKPYWRIEGRVSEFIPGLQSDAALACLPDGRFGVAWCSARQLKGRSGVFVRLFDRYGRPLSPEKRVASGFRYPELKPSLVFLPNGEPLVFYESLFRDGSLSGVFAADQRVNVQTRGDQTDIVTAVAPDGRLLSVWVSQVSRQERRLFARFLDSKGQPLTSEFRVSDAVSGSEAAPSVCFGAGGAVVAWQRFEANGSPGGIYVQRLALNGTPLGAPRQIAGREALEPSITPAGSGFILAWVEAVEDGRHRVCATRLDSRLKRLGSPIDAPPQPGSQNAASVAGRPDGSFLLAWNHRHAGEKDIFLQLFDAQGRARSGAIRITAHCEGKQGLAEASGRTHVAYAPDGTITLVWHGEGGLGDPAAVHFTRLIPASTLTAVEKKQLQAVDKRTRALLARVVDPKTAGEVKVAVVHEKAEPHVPPVYDPSTQEDPWGADAFLSDASGFMGIIDTGWYPPDPILAVGPNHIVAMTNGAIAFFTKDGTKTFQQPIEGASGFWGSLGATGFVFDPEVLYDPVSGRFFAMAAEGYAPGNRSYVLVAVSDDSDPHGTWYKYRFETTALAGDLFDSPNIGVDASVVYITGDGFGRGANYPVYTFDKASLLRGDPPAVQRSTTLNTTTQSAGIPPISYGNPPAYYLIEHREGSANTSVRLIALKDPLGTITFTDYSLTVPTYGPPEDPPQQGTSVRPETFDARFWSVVYVNGFLWATHHVNSSRVRARWYQIRMNGWPDSGLNPELVQSGEIDPGGTVRTFFSSISADDQGNAAVVCARSSPTEYISIYRAARRASDPLGTMPHTAIVKTSTGPYGRSRWGDYSGCRVDPADNRTFWGCHEWAEGSSWRTWIFSFRPPQAGDVNGDGCVNDQDLQAVLVKFGQNCTGCPEDLNGDGVVNDADLSLVLSNYGAGC